MAAADSSCGYARWLQPICCLPMSPCRCCRAELWMPTPLQPWQTESVSYRTTALAFATRWIWCVAGLTQRAVGVLSLHVRGPGRSCSCGLPTRWRFSIRPRPACIRPRLCVAHSATATQLARMCRCPSGRGMATEEKRGGTHRIFSQLGIPSRSSLRACVDACRVSPTLSTSAPRRDCASYRGRGLTIAPTSDLTSGSTLAKSGRCATWAPSAWIERARRRRAGHA